MRSSLTARALSLLAFAALALGGCGLKGDLYLPEPAEAEQQQAGEPESNDADDADSQY